METKPTSEDLRRPHRAAAMKVRSAGVCSAHDPLGQRTGNDAVWGLRKQEQAERNEDLRDAWEENRRAREFIAGAEMMPLALTEGRPDLARRQVVAFPFKDIDLRRGTDWRNPKKVGDRGYYEGLCGLAGKPMTNPPI